MYTPEFLIKRNQYTIGRQFVDDGDEYIGYYNVTARGAYTGRVFSTAKSRPLFPYKEVPTDSAVEYLALTEETGHISDHEYSDPLYSIEKPIYPDDYKIGFFFRYFIKKRNNITSRVIEISKSEFNELPGEGAGLNPNFYKAIKIKWKLTGPKNDVMNEKGMIAQYGVVDTNYRMLLQKDHEMPGIFGSYKQFTARYSKYDDITTQNIDINNLNEPTL